jgi:hypothetical protein
MIKRLFLLLLTLAAAVHGQPLAGYILDVEGVWTASAGIAKPRSTPLARGQHVAPGAILTNSAPSDFDRLVVAGLTGEVIKRIRCRKGACRECGATGSVCLDPIRPMPPAKPRESVWTVTFDAIMKLLAEKGDTYSAHRSRGAGEMADAVARFENGKLDMRQALPALAKGRYLLVVRLLNVPGSTRTLKTSVDWEPAAPAPIEFAELTPGLWQMSMVQSGSQGENLTEAWVLVASEPDYAHLQASYQEAITRAAKWDKSVVSPATSLVYLRAALDHLSEDYAKRR